VAAAWREFAVEAVQDLLAWIDQTAMTLLILASRYYAWIASSGELFHKREIRGTGESWRLLGVGGEQDDRPNTEHTGAHGSPLGTWLMPHSYLAQGLKPALTVHGATPGDLRVGIEDSFFRGEDWKRIGAAGAIYEQLAALAEEVRSAVPSATLSPARPALRQPNSPLPVIEPVTVSQLEATRRLER
jgi:hypothetical protein